MPAQAIPLPLSGNTTEEQNANLQECLAEAARSVYGRVIEQLDRQTAQNILEAEDELRSEMVSLMEQAIHRRTISERFRDEEVGSDRVYPPDFRVRHIDAQLIELRKFFPSLGACEVKLSRRPLVPGAEAWFAIPRWQAVAPTYNAAVETVLGIVASRRRLDNRIAGRLGPAYLRQSERSKLAERMLAEQQPGNDILIVAAQAGMLHRGTSARRTRVSMAPNEFGLGVFAFGCMLLTHPERLSMCETLMVDCGGDEYSVHGNGIFDRVPLFDYDLKGIEFSFFYEDRARNLWGTPTGFLWKAA